MSSQTNIYLSMLLKLILWRNERLKYFENRIDKCVSAVLSMKYERASAVLDGSKSLRVMNVSQSLAVVWCMPVLTW